jgi:hypothetical protein
MRLFRRSLFPFLLLAGFAILRAQDAAPPILPPVKITVPNVFSYQPPPGWGALRPIGFPYPVAMEKKGDAGAGAGLGFTPAMITVNTDTASLPLPEWCSKSLAKNKAQFAKMNAQIGELERFPTASPTIIGFRAPIDVTVKDRKLHYVMYFFNGNGDTKLAVTCICAQQDAARYAPIFDAAMRTFYPY